MPLGTRLGSDEITAPLGSGGPSFAHETSDGGSAEAIERTCW
jgi:hypothetical protein